MSRRHAYVSPPECPHWKDLDARYREQLATWRYQQGVYPDDTPEPTPPGLYCDSCRAELYQPGAVWPLEIWDYLNMIADRDAARKGTIGRLKGAPTLPPDPKPRSLTPAKWLQLAIDAFEPDTDPKFDARTHSVIGQAIRAEVDYRITTTNGHCLVAEPGSGRAPVVTGGIDVTRSGPWIDLPADLQLALKRVALFSNERLRAVTIAIDRDFGRIHLRASSMEGEASEYLDNGLINQSADLPEGFEVCLSADYLDRVCGCWPVRWYVRPAEELTTAPTKFNPNPKPYLSERPQLFCPTGTDARVLIMPMRI